MDLSKKTLLGALVSLILLASSTAIATFIGIDQGNVDAKTLYVFELIFALVGLGSIIATTLFMQKDMALDNKTIIILVGLFIVFLFDITVVSIQINGLTSLESQSSINATYVLPAIVGVISIPSIAGAGYALSL